MAIGGTGFRIVWNEAEFRRLVRGPDGPVFRHLAVIAEDVAQVARRLCPVSVDGSMGRPPGTLRDSIGFDLDQDNRGLFADVGASAGAEDGYEYGMGVELGTRPHVIESRGDWPLRDRYGNVFGRVVLHPGTDPQPFLRPALDQVVRR